MPVTNHIILFSHGFGVRSDDRGMFTDIASILAPLPAIMFDYNEVDTDGNTLTVRPFSKQVEILKKVIEKQKTDHPKATIDLICHSQGCRVAALLCASGIRKTILISPPTDSGIERMVERYIHNPAATLNFKGVSQLPRSDGSITFVPPEYWKERQNETDPIDLYNQLAEVTQLTIIKPTNDTVLGNTSFENLTKKAALIELVGDHDFTYSRNMLCETVKKIIL